MNDFAWLVILIVALSLIEKFPEIIKAFGG